MNVAFVVGTLGRGGAERQLLYALNALSGTPVKTRVLCLTRGEALEEEITRLEVPVDYVGARQSRRARLAAIVSSLRSRPTDIVHSSHFYTNLYAAVAAPIAGAVSIGSVRSDLRSELRANGIFGLAHLHAPRFLVANSEAASKRAALLGRASSRLFVLENAVDAERFSPRRQLTPLEFGLEGEPHGATERDDREKSLRLLLVGRLVPQKRVDRFLRVVQTLASYPNQIPVEARIVGGGPLRHSLEAQARGLATQGTQVSFLGEVSDPRPHYDWADLLILTSDNEGTPNVILEAMASGLPVVASAVGGVPRLLSAGGGILVPAGDEAGLANAAAAVRADPTLAERLGKEGRDAALVRSGSLLARQLHRIYLASLEERRG